MTTVVVSAGLGAVVSFAATLAFLRRRYRADMLAQWEQQLEDAYDLGRKAGQELYWLDLMTMPPNPVDVVAAWNPNAKDGAADSRDVMFQRGRHDGWWQAANFDVDEAIDYITREAA